MFKKWVRNGKVGLEPTVSDTRMLRLTYRLRVLSSLSNMVNLVIERNLSLILTKATENR